VIVEWLAAAAVLIVAVLIGRLIWVRWRHPDATVCVTEEETRKNAAPLTTAIVSRLRSGADQR
jgi:hypothetical protein